MPYGMCTAGGALLRFAIGSPPLEACLHLDAEYIKCRRMGMSIANSLAEWDLLDMQKIHTLINEAQSGNFA